MSMLFIGCEDSSTDTLDGHWEFLGLEEKLVLDLVLSNNHLYACAGKDGLFRLDVEEAEAEWQYLGFAECLRLNIKNNFAVNHL